MKGQPEDRAILLAHYIVENGATVRAAAKMCGISKSTVHKDVTERLPRLDPILFGEVRRVLDLNREQRHLRGGAATRQKYLNRNSDGSGGKRTV